jgi:hypothetical protein
MLIVNACDQEYLPRTKALITSVLKNTDFHIYVHLVNVSERIDHPRVMEFHETKEFSDIEYKRDYMANLRPYLFLRLWEKFDNVMLWLDSDSIVRANLKDLEKIISECDVAAVDTPEMAGYGCEMNEKLISTVGINNTDDAKDFLIEWIKIQDGLRAWKEYAPSIMTVQLAYVRALKALPVRFTDLTYRFSDKFFRDESPIWEAQGDRKHNDKKYLDEEAKYLKEYANICGQLTSPVINLAD